MPREVGNVQREFPPTVTRSRIGETLTACLVDERNIPSTFVNQITRQREPRLDPTTKKQKNDLIITAVVVQGDMRVARKGEELRAPEPGEVVEFYFSQGAYAAYIQAKNDLLRATGRKTALSGDVIYFTTDSAVLYTQQGDKVGTFTTQAEVDAHRLAGRQGTIGFRGQISLTAPTPEYASWVQAADEAFDRRLIERSQRPVGDQNGPFDDGPDEAAAFNRPAPAPGPIAPPPAPARRLV